MKASGIWVGREHERSERGKGSAKLKRRKGKMDYWTGNGKEQTKQKKVRGKRVNEMETLSQCLRR